MGGPNVQLSRSAVFVGPGPGSADHRYRFYLDGGVELDVVDRSGNGKISTEGDEISAYDSSGQSVATGVQAFDTYGAPAERAIKDCRKNLEGKHLGRLFSDLRDEAKRAMLPDFYSCDPQALAAGRAMPKISSAVLKRLKNDFRQEYGYFSISDGAIRNLHFQEGVTVSLAEFFLRYGEVLKFRWTEGDSFKHLPDRTHTDAMGTHHYFQQYYKGREVYAAEYHLVERNGRVASATNNMIVGLDLDLSKEPNFSEADALTRAREAIGADATLQPIAPASLVISTEKFASKAEMAHLVWLVNFPTHKIHVEAYIGAVVNREETPAGHAGGMACR